MGFSRGLPMVAVAVVAVIVGAAVFLVYLPP